LLKLLPSTVCFINSKLLLHFKFLKIVIAAFACLT